MELEGLILQGIELIKSDPIIAIGIMVIVALLFYFKTKPMLKLLVILLACGFVFYFLTLLGGLTSTGLIQKKDMIQQDRE